MSSSTATAVVPVTGTGTGAAVQPSSTSDRSVASRAVQHVSSSAPSSQAVPSPGRFRHPRMTEIARRRAASSCSARNVQSAMLNVVMLLGTFLAGDLIHTGLLSLCQATGLTALERTPSILVASVRLLLCANIYVALRPVLPYVSKPDNVDDIPLTPSQRALLGLARSRSSPSASPTGDGSGNYITPPRYRRSSPSGYSGTPHSGATNRASYSASPLSTSRYTVGFSPTPQQASGTPTRRPSGSPFSPSSPLFQKALMSPQSRPDILPSADFTESTRSLLAGTTSTSSFQTSLRRSQSTRERGRVTEPGTPSPKARERSKVQVQPGLNYKWLYEKGLRVGKNGNVEYD